ncbi:MAG: ABC transporter ATP-binding protein [Verrucomicrobia bacterium]|nr:ABC transporter ATP-binding protein [Verrucomicrobiota bacterium]
MTTFRRQRYGAGAATPWRLRDAIAASEHAGAQLVVDRVEVAYDHAIVALHGVSLTVCRGEVVALVGANGAGKTTTLRAVSNLLGAVRGQLTAGCIRFDGHDVSRTSPADLVRLGLVQVLEGRHCFRTLTVEENLIIGGLARGSRRAELAQDLERVYGTFPRLRDKRKTRSGLTSGGEQQMTAIGRALMSRPKLLVLDEPSMGLAPLVVHGIFQTLTELNKSSGLSILVAEQNSTVALQFAHRAVVLDQGVAVLAGSADELGRRSDIKAYYLGEFVEKPGLSARLSGLAPTERT